MSDDDTWRVSAESDDARWASRLAKLQAGVLLGVVTVSGGVLLGWGIAFMEHWLPPGWDQMTASTAGACLLLALSHWDRFRHGFPEGIFPVLAGGSVLVLSTVALFGRMAGVDGIGALMALSVSSYLMLAGLTLLLDRLFGRHASLLRDALLVLQILLVLTLVGIALPGARSLVAQPVEASPAVPTLVCLVMLTLAQMAYHARHGAFSLLVGRGFASQLLRWGWPAMVAVTLGMAVGWGWEANQLADRQVVALSAALAATLPLVVILLLGGHIGRLEARLQAVSLTDPMTGIYNRLAFETIGEQVRRLARREGEPLSLIVLDLDDLRQVNDSQGYEAGSQMIIDFADLLATHTRESDLLARIGGDEFAVLMRIQPANPMAVLTRLETRREAFNAERRRPYSIDYCRGEVMIAPDDASSLASLVDIAEARMTLRKERKRAWKAGTGNSSEESRSYRPRPAQD